MFVNDLADAVRAGGLAVVETPGWVGRNHGALSAVNGIVLHHTGSSSANAWTVVRDGRPDLEGPLANMTLERDGTVRIICNGVAWHAGTGTWPSIGTNNGNAYCLGIEAVYNGGDITDAQRRAYPMLAAALVRRYGIPVGNVIGHREWATPAGRKSDPGQIDLPAFRATVAALVSGASPAPAPSPTTRKRLPSMIERPFGPGGSAHRVVCPTGPKASQLVSAAWLSVSIDGGARVEVWAQAQAPGKDAPAGSDIAARAYRDWTLRAGDRPYLELPDGTEMVTVHVTGSTGPGSILIEQKAA